MTGHSQFVVMFVVMSLEWVTVLVHLARHQGATESNTS